MTVGRPIFYVYPMFKHVSWNYIADKHCEYLKNGLRLYRIDENALPFIEIYSNPLVLLHPFFYPFQKWEQKLTRKFTNVHGVIGMDVADSDRISDYAVRLTNYSVAMIVPSNFSKKSYIRSGVKVPVHVVPHGADDFWFEHDRTTPSSFKILQELKSKYGVKLILSYMLHSPYRKGLDLLVKIYNEIKDEYGKVMLVVKGSQDVKLFQNKVKLVNDNICGENKTILTGWLNENQMMELYDICDMYILTSRGGGFEHPPLLALIRGEVVIGSKGGAWEDYLPEWSLIPSRKSSIVLAGNPIHIGVGVEMLVEKTVDKALEIFNNLDDYKVRVREYVNTHVKENFTWHKICSKFSEVISKYM